MEESGGCKIRSGFFSFFKVLELILLIVLTDILLWLSFKV
jgi:hypothetical protein